MLIDFPDQHPASLWLKQEDQRTKTAEMVANMPTQVPLLINVSLNVLLNSHNPSTTRKTGKNQDFQNKIDGHEKSEFLPFLVKFPCFPCKTKHLWHFGDNYVIYYNLNYYLCGKKYPSGGKPIVRHPKGGMGIQ